MDQAILEKEALKLPVHERALLVDALLSSLDTETSREIERAWAAEAEDRYQAYRAGKLEAVDGPAAIKELRTRLAP
jgi:putative addiction module component (TIGR02574 family)